jgi:hypothetical protein
VRTNVLWRMNSSSITAQVEFCKFVEYKEVTMITSS